MNENVSLDISRQLLSEVGAHLTKLQENSIAKAVSHYTLEIVQPRVIAFEDQVNKLVYKTVEVVNKNLLEYPVSNTRPI